MTTSKVLVDRYLQGRDILTELPEDRTDKDLSFLKKWLPEKIPLFGRIDSGEERELANFVLFCWLQILLFFLYIFCDFL